MYKNQSSGKRVWESCNGEHNARVQNKANKKEITHQSTLRADAHRNQAQHSSCDYHTNIRTYDFDPSSSFQLYQLFHSCTWHLSVEMPCPPWSCAIVKHFPRPLQSLGHENFSQALPWNPSKQAHSPVTRLHNPAPEHSRSACAIVIAVGTLSLSAGPAGQIRTSHRGDLARDTSASDPHPGSQVHDRVAKTYVPWRLHIPVAAGVSHWNLPLPAVQLVVVGRKEKKRMRRGTRGRFNSIWFALLLL